MPNLITRSGTKNLFFNWFRQPKFRKDQWIAAVRKSESAATSMSDSALLERAGELRELFADASPREKQLLREQYAGLIAESVFRSLGFRLFDVQLEGVGAASDGAIIEMQTGEGKTVVTGCIAALKTLEVPTVHVSTTNSYLADRDCDELAPIFDRMGISHGKLPEESNESASRLAYRQQIVYGPGYQFGFDYLHDQMKLRQQRKSRLGKDIVSRIRGGEQGHKMIQPTRHYVSLIDEADSVMIDEALTPLIISVPGNTPQDPVPYQLAKKIAAELIEDEDYTIKLPEKSIEIFDETNQRVHDKIAGHRDLLLARPWKAYISNAIRAEKILQKDVDYVVLEEKIQLVDQYTGRILPDRTWQAGLHQAIEVKENVPMQPARESTTQVTRQRYLQMYDSLSGLTGTAQSVSEEFREIYKCPIVVIPTNRPSQRHIEQTRFFVDAESKIAAIAEDVLRRHQKNQPILIGTRTIRESMQIDEALRARNIEAVLLNGVQDGDEAEIVSKAGIAGAITIATNMAGRGTDIKPDERALAAGGLHVIAVSPNESPRIDRQLIGRGARQGQPGSAQFFVAADDALLVDHNSSLPKQILRKAGAGGESADFSNELAALQKSIEQAKFKQRQQMILRDRWMDSVRESIEKD
jgi:preprotein translocase subunit SecA